MAHKLSIEEVIQEAARDGVFSNLPGKGKPLKIDTSPDAIVNGILKEANVKPEWAELAPEIEKLHEEAATLLDSFGRRHRALLQALQADSRSSADSEPEQDGSWWRRVFVRPSEATRGQPVPELTTLAELRSIATSRYAVLLHRTNRT